MSEPGKHIVRSVMEQVETCVQMRDAHPMERLMAGEPPMEFGVCLGPGRCMTSGIDFTPNQLMCPFCRWYPNDLASSRVHRKDEFVLQHTQGN